MSDGTAEAKYDAAACPFDVAHKGWAVNVSRDRLCATGTAHGRGSWVRLGVSIARGKFSYTFVTTGDYAWFGLATGQMQPGEDVQSRHVWLQGALP